MEQRSDSQRQSRKMALCGMMAALSVVILSLGGLIPLATFICPILAMVCLVPVVCEYGAGAAALLYGAAAVLGLLLCPDKEIALIYVFLGWYPGIRSRLDKSPRLVGGMIKCALFTVSMVMMYVLILYLFRLDVVVEEFSEYTPTLVISLLVMGDVTFLLFDRVLGRLTMLYQKKQGV